MAPKGVRQKDVAVEAGVSTATVSRFFNDPSKLSATKRVLVADTLRRMGAGVPASQVIGLIVPDASNPFFSQLISFFERELARHGVHLVPASSDGRLDREVDLIDRFRSMGVSGLFYTPTRAGGEAVLQLIASGDIPVLAFDRQVAAGNLDCVTTDSRKAMQMLVDYLIIQGHERFGYIKGVEGTTTASERAESFARAMSTNGLTVEDRLVFQGDYRFSGGRDAAEQFLVMSEHERPTAVIAANDLMAIGFMQRVQQAGLSVPHQISVAGFDGIDYASWYSPSLTTIVQPVRRLVHEATNLLLARIEATEKGDSPPQQAIAVRPQLVIRDSVGVAPTPERLRPQLHRLPGVKIDFTKAGK